MKKKLTRDQEQVVVAGVLSGLAKYYNQDPVLFRIAAIAFILLTGIFPGLLIYILAWLIVPKEDRNRVDFEVVE